MSNNIVLEIKNIRKKIGNRVIINDVSLQLNKGEILGFIGTNGAGKTTTIKLMLGLQQINSGSVKICGYDLKKDFEKAISNVGAIIENPDLYMYMSGYENLKIAVKLHKIDEARILEVARLVGLEDRIYDKVKKYSLGMRQRLGLAQAIIHKPKLLILDEPMNGLDPEGLKALKQLLKRLAKEEKIAILISSHILSELENICDRICILSKGYILQDKKTEEIKKMIDTSSYILTLSQTNIQKILCNFQKIDDSRIKINTSKENISNILKAILLNNIDIYEVKKETVSLEDIFLKMTKDNND